MLIHSRENPKYLEEYLDELVDCAQKLASNEGAPTEGSLAYGRLVLEFLILLILISNKVGYILPSLLVKRTKSIIDWLDKVLGPENRFPPLGDDSGERAFPFNDYFYDGIECLLVGQAVFKKTLSKEISPAASMLIESLGLEPKIAGESRFASSSFLDNNIGYGRITSISDIGRFTVWMRAGSYGLAPIFAHSHSDFISPIVWLNGYPVLGERRVSETMSQLRD